MRRGGRLVYGLEWSICTHAGENGFGAAIGSGGVSPSPPGRVTVGRGLVHAETRRRGDAEGGRTYLRLMNIPISLLINLSAATFRQGLHRVVNNLPPSASPRLRVIPRARLVAVP